MDLTACLTIASAGIATHLVFQSFDPDCHLQPLLLAYVGGWVLLAWGLSLLEASFLYSIFTVSFIASVSLYRGLFHRLRHFPGPWQARLSRLYLVARTYRSLQLHLELERLHSIYGDFVRTGPREISIIRPSAIQTIYSRVSRCHKSLWYAHVSDTADQVSVHMCRDPTSHQLRRKIWDKALNLRGVKDGQPTYEHAIADKATSMIRQIRSCMQKNRSVDAAHWSSLFASDIMGLVGFGDDFGQVESGQQHPAMSNLHHSMELVGRWTPAPWVINLLASIPRITRMHSSFLDHCSKLVERKLKALHRSDEQPPKDIISWLITAMKQNDPGKPPSIEALHEDGRLVVIAGADTLSSTLAHALYYLTAHPDEYSKLQQELDNEHLVRFDGTINTSSLGSLPYLEAIINETMRLRPAAPSGQPRMTPPGGLQVDEVWIPGKVNVVIPQHVLHRDARFFPRGQEFLPQRWIDNTVCKESFFPFGIGPRSCVGKQLALLELRIMITQIALNFDLEFSDEKAAEIFITQGKDTVTYTVPPLPLNFRDRQGKIVSKE